MDAFLNNLAASLTSSVVILGLAAYFGRSFVERFLARNMKEFEAALKFKTDSEMAELQASLKVKSDTIMEQLKSDLQRRSIEHQTRFSKLHVKSAEVIEKVNALLGEVVWAAEDLFAPLQRGGDEALVEKYNILATKLTEMFRYIDQYRIYLDEQTGEMVQAIALDLRKHMIFHDTYRDVNHFAPANVLKEKRDGMMAAWQAMRVEIPAARKKLETEFRRLLGH